MEKSRTLKTLLDKLEYEPVQGTLEREISSLSFRDACSFVLTEQILTDMISPHRRLHRAPGCWWYKRT